MTVIKTHSDNGEYYIELKGHASGESDQICAAISGIVYALAGYLDNSQDIDVECCRLDAGDVEISFYGYEDAEAVYQMTVIGLMQIAQQYPDYAKFS